LTWKSAGWVVVLALSLIPARSLADDHEFQIQWDRFGSDRFPQLMGHVTVLRGPQTVTDLKPAEFRLYEDGVEQTSLSVVPETEGVDVGLVVDTSGSMREALPRSLGAVRAFILNLHPEDRAALLDFSDHPRVLQPFTSNFRLFEAALQKSKADGGTAIYDSLGTVAALFPQGFRRRVVVLMTDGNDQNAMGTGPGSRLTLDQALAQCRDERLTVFTIGLGFQVDRRVLTQIAGKTGGRAFWATDAGELQDLYLEIIRDIQRRYQVAYRTSNPFPDGSLRTVRLQIQHEGWFGEGSTTYWVARDGAFTGGVSRPDTPPVPPQPWTPTPSPVPTETPRVWIGPERVDSRLELQWGGQKLGAVELGQAILSLDGKILDGRQCRVETWPALGVPEVVYHLDRRLFLTPGSYRFRIQVGDRWYERQEDVQAGVQTEVTLRAVRTP